MQSGLRRGSLRVPSFVSRAVVMLWIVWAVATVVVVRAQSDGSPSRPSTTPRVRAWPAPGDARAIPAPQLSELEEQDERRDAVTIDGSIGVSLADELTVVGIRDCSAQSRFSATPAHLSTGRFRC
jgi:hypothetical protein